MSVGGTAPTVAINRGNDIPKLSEVSAGSHSLVGQEYESLIESTAEKVQQAFWRVRQQIHCSHTAHSGKMCLPLPESSILFPVLISQPFIRSPECLQKANVKAVRPPVLRESQ